jgi:uncharacterized protein (TIGR02391 family)
VRINNRIKKFTGLKIDGAPLMRMVFSRKNPIIALNSLSTVEDSDAQEGWMHIFEGCMLAFRNPSSHNDELEVEKNDATGILGLANYLMRLLDLKLKDTP